MYSKKIVFSGYLTNDKDSFAEIALCCYNFKKDGKECFKPFVSMLDISPTFSKGNIYSANNVDEFVDYVFAQQFCKTDVEKLIKGINKYPYDAIAVFSTEAESHLCERLREAAFPD